ncbi:EamA family transporter RarD [Tepidibacillus fermentans]|uniref:Chloramphenicol-sensitive protein RarD n=1 Tax=Tepidibacillus fermentans TaxID=1281767 RepID=A0A4R3KL63_9BACI|nr:EamA family transporter RarD [Tepidibacillus fermentans]TCS84477.1 chloramphenicol-sensitive protein RarD [Tepidibacillus fermentans]
MLEEDKKIAIDSKGIGVLYGILAYTAWGLLPLYWKLLKQITAFEILAHRIVWSFVFVVVLVLISSNWIMIKKVIHDRKKILFITINAFTITLNWGTYIWAVNAGHVLETSLGYYINPLVTVLLGMVFLKEKLNNGQKIALGLAFIGVMLMTIHYGKTPWIALILASSFGFYGLIKKIVHVDSVTGLTLETAIILPFALGFILFKQWNGLGALGNLSVFTTILLLLSGVATAIPLLWFAKSAERIELSTLGFLQYISPTITLLLGIFIFHEQFSRAHLIGFGFIWAALVIYSFSKTSFKKAQPMIINTKV